MSLHIKGIRIEITFLFAALIAFILSLRVPSNVLITVCSSFAHETGHLIAMSVLGNRPEAVRLELTGINIKRTASVKISMKNEILTALGGPLANGIVFLICTLLLCFYKNVTVFTVSAVNLILMTFNLLPVNRLDGGMILFYLLSVKYDRDFCLRFLKISSSFFIAVIYIWGFYVFFVSKYNMSVLIIAVFLTFSMFGREEY